MAADDITTTIQGLVDCVCAALSDAGRAACSCGLTIGPPVIGPQQCCACKDGTGGQVTGNLETVFPADGATLEPDSTRLENCRAGVTAANVAIVVARCYPTVDKAGKMPSLEKTTTAADGMHQDIQVVWNALKCCGSPIVFREMAVDNDPDGGCSAFAVRVTVPVGLPKVEAVGS